MRLVCIYKAAGCAGFVPSADNSILERALSFQSTVYLTVDDIWTCHWKILKAARVLDVVWRGSVENFNQHISHWVN